jgi:hypothetical protein
MNARLKRVASEPVTPAEDMTDYLVDKIDAIMICCGIKEIVAQKYTCGFGSRLHVTMTPFEDAPPEIVRQGLVVKDAIAQLLSVINLSKLALSDFSAEEMSNIHAMWAAAIEAAKHPRNEALQPTAQVPQTESKADGGDIQLDLSGVTPKADDEPKRAQRSSTAVRKTRRKKNRGANNESKRTGRGNSSGDSDCRGV